MEIPRSLLDSLTDEVNALSNAAQAQARKALARVFAAWDGSDIAALRVSCIEVLNAVCGTYADLSAARGAEFYDAAREAQGVRGSYRAVADSRRDTAKTESSVRALIESVKRHGDTGVFGRSLLSRVDLEVRRSANDCVAYNVRRDPKRPRYARVPSGGETCGFCLMLASFGFNWRSAEQASHSHKHCDCRVVPSFGKGSVPGYDPDEMYGRFNECLSTLGGRERLREEWLAIPEGDRGDFQKYVNKMVSKEIESRDPAWFATGKVPDITKERGAKPLPKERYVSEALADSGFAVEFIKEVNKKGVKTADVRLCGAVWEFKVPEGYNGEHTVRKQFWKARDKGTSKLLISCTENHAPAEDVCKWVSETFKKGDYEYIDEVLVMADDGTLTRMKRPK